jgi:hypothetical protein
MAAATDIAQPTISSIIAGRYEPGARVLAKLASLPAVNPEWVYSGQGVPFRVKRTPKGRIASPAFFLPITQTPLRTTPEQSTAMFTGEVHPVSAESFSPTRYWWEIALGEYFTPSMLRELRLHERDLVLIETHPDVVHDPAHFVGRLGIVVGETNHLRIAPLDWDSEPETGERLGLLAGFVAGSNEAVEEQDATKEPVSFRHQYDKRLADPISPDRVCGVAVMMVRRTLR